MRTGSKTPKTKIYYCHASDVYATRDVPVVRFRSRYTRYSEKRSSKSNVLMFEQQNQNRAYKIPVCLLLFYCTLMFIWATRSQLTDKLKNLTSII